MTDYVIHFPIEIITKSGPLKSWGNKYDRYDYYGKN